MRQAIVRIIKQLSISCCQTHQQQCSSEAGSASLKRLRLHPALRQCTACGHCARRAPHGRACSQGLGCGDCGHGHHCALLARLRSLVNTAEGLIWIVLCPKAYRGSDLARFKKFH